MKLLNLALFLSVVPLEVLASESDAYVERGKLSLRENDYTLARDSYNHALEKDQNNEAAHFGLGIVMIFSCEPNGALEHFKRAVELGRPRNSEHDSVYWLLGLDYRNLGQEALAVEAFQNYKREVTRLAETSSFWKEGLAHNLERADEQVQNMKKSPLFGRAAKLAEGECIDE